MPEVRAWATGGASSLLERGREAGRDRILFLDAAGARLAVSSGSDAGDPMVAEADEPTGDWLEEWPETSRVVLATDLEEARAGRITRRRVERVEEGERRIWDVTIAPATNAGAARLLILSRDVTEDVREMERGAAVLAETRHRLKNGMTIAAGLVMLEARSQPELRGFAASVCRRFEQLAVVQDMVLDRGSKDLPKILHLLAGVYGDGSLLRVGELPALELNDFAAQALALTFGELATNSLKYGALKAARPVHLTGALEAGRLTLCWREPTRFVASRVGSQGLSLIDRLIAAAGGEVVRSIGADLLEVRVTVPAS
jgi:two-component sensor histidine kinase